MKRIDNIGKFSIIRPKTCGFTLTEIAIVLAIIGLILGAVWSAASGVYRNNHIKQMLVDTTTIVNNWKSIFSSKRVDVTPDGTDMTQMTIDNNFVPADMTTFGCPGTAPACQLVNAGSGDGINIISDVADNAIEFDFQGLTQEECNFLGNTLGPTAGVGKAQINTNTALKFPPLGTDTAFSGATVSAQCSITAATGNEIKFYFLMK